MLLVSLRLHTYSADDEQFADEKQEVSYAVQNKCPKIVKYFTLKINSRYQNLRRKFK